MDEELTQRKMQDQVEQLQETPLSEQYDWDIEIDGLDVFITLPRSDGESDYTLKVNFENYPQQAPSYTFVDNWPDVRGIDENRGGICIDGTRECYNEYNHDERLDNWDPETYDLPSMVHKIYGMVT